LAQNDTAEIYIDYRNYKDDGRTLYNYYSIYDYYAFMNANYGDMFVVEPPSIDSKTP
jgi:hypothetical protein